MENKFSMYKPRKGSFPYHEIKYLYAYGESGAKDIRFAIGLNEHSQYSAYPDRSSYYFGCIQTRLRQKGVIQRTKRGYYKLTKKWRELAPTI
jgi:hypothetical protein